GAFTVEFYKAKRVLGEKRIEASSRRYLAIAGVDADEFLFYLRYPKFVEHRIIVDRRILYLLQCAPDRVADTLYSFLIVACEEMRAEVGRQRPSIKDEAILLDAFMKDLK